MITAAIKNNHKPNRKFFLGDNYSSADFSIASGIFNVKLNFDIKLWKYYIIKTINRINHKSKKGFSFNLLSNTVVKEKKEKYLYYANPAEILNYCLKNFSNNITLMHNYNLFEFTILVNK